MDEEILKLLENLIRARGKKQWQTREDPCPKGCCYDTIVFCSGCNTEYNLRFVDAPPPVDERPHDNNCYFKNEYPKLVAWAKAERELLEANG